MSVTVDAVGPGSSGTSVGNSSTLSWTHVSSGSQRLIIVTATLDIGTEAGRTLSATCDGVSMTSFGVVHSNNGAAGYVQMWRLVGQASGSNAIVITMTGTTSGVFILGGSVSFNGVDQTTPVGTPVTGFGGGTTASITVASATGNMVIDGIANGSSITSSTQTNRWKLNLNGNSGAGNAASSTAAGASSVTMQYAITNDIWAMIGVNVRAALVISGTWSSEQSMII